jgi:hypothetical protein
MAWPKGKKRNQATETEENTSQDAPLDVQGNEQQGESETVEENREMPEISAQIDAEVATQDTWRFHENEEPRVFKKGEIIPEGWTDDRHHLWHRHQSGGRWEKHADLKR